MPSQTLHPNYERILGSEEELLSKESEGNQRNIRRDVFNSKTLPWICCICLLLLLGVQSFYYTGLRRRVGTYETGFATEFGPLHSAIDVIEVQFDGTMAYTETGHLYLDIGEDGVRYFGKPSPEIDEAWKNLVGKNWNFYISDEERDALHSDSQKFPAYPGRIGPDVLHTLHCLNEVRKVLDSEYYYNTTLKGLTRLRRLHIDHCMNHIRQSIQCHMDLTPVTKTYFESANTVVGNFDQVHMCRDISKLREWMVQRMPLSAKFKPTPNSHDHHHAGYILNDDALFPWDSTEPEYY